MPGCCWECKFTDNKKSTKSGAPAALSPIVKHPNFPKMSNQNEEDNDEDPISLPEFKEASENCLKEMSELGTKLKLKTYKITPKLKNADEHNIGEVVLNIVKYLKVFKVNIDRLILAYQKSLKAVNKSVNSAGITESLSVLELLNKFCVSPSAFDSELDASGHSQTRRRLSLGGAEGRIETVIIVDEDPQEDNKDSKKIHPKKTSLSLQKRDTQNTNDSWEDTLSRSAPSDSNLLNEPKNEVQDENREKTDANKEGIDNISTQEPKNEQTTQGDKQSQSSESSGTTIVAGPPSPRTLRMMYVDREMGVLSDDSSSSVVRKLLDGAHDDSPGSSNDAFGTNDDTNSAVDDSAIESDNRSVSDCNAIREYRDTLTEDTEGETLDCAEELPRDEAQSENRNDSEETQITIENNDKNDSGVIEGNVVGENNNKKEKGDSVESQASSLNMTLQEIEDFVAREIAEELSQIENEKIVSEAEKSVENAKTDENLSNVERAKENFENFDKELDEALSTPIVLQKISERGELNGSREISGLDKDVEELEKLLSDAGPKAIENEKELPSNEEIASTPTEIECDSPDIIENTSEDLDYDEVNQDPTQINKIIENDLKLSFSSSDTTFIEENQENVKEEDGNSNSSFVFDIQRVEVISEGVENDAPEAVPDATEASYLEVAKNEELDDIFSESVASLVDTTYYGYENKEAVLNEINSREAFVLVEDINRDGGLEVPEIKQEISPKIKEEFSQVIDSYVRDKGGQLENEDKDELLRLLDSHIADSQEAVQSESEDDRYSEGDDRAAAGAARNRDLLEELLDDYFKSREGASTGEQPTSAADDLTGVGSDTTLLDVVREEVVNEEDLERYGREKELDDSHAYDIAMAWLEEDDDSLESSSENANDGPDDLYRNVSDYDIEKSDLDLSDTTPPSSQKQTPTKNDESVEEGSLVEIKDFSVKLERMEVNGINLPNTLPKKKRRKSTDGTSESDIDRLCDISTLDNPPKEKSRSARKRLRLKKARRGRRSSSSSSSSSASSLYVSSGDEAAHRWSDPDDLGVAPLEPDGKDEEALMANALVDLIRDSAEETEGGYESDSEEGRETKKDKEKGEELLKRRKKRKRSKWEYDSLLHGKLSSGDNTDSSSKCSSCSEKHNPTKKPKVLSGCSSDSDVAIKKEVETPKKVLFNLSDITDSGNSDVEFISADKRRVRRRLVSSQDENSGDDDDESKKKGRRNIRSLLSDEKLAASTQRANREEEERIARLEEKKKLAESLSQSMSSQISDDGSLVLDFDKETSEPLVTVHPKLCKRLKPHQRLGVSFMWDSCYESVKRLKRSKGSGCILAHCMGLGKTFQALTLVHTLFSHPVTNTKHVLVVCPLSTVSNWKNEFEIAFRKIKRCDINIFALGDKRNVSGLSKADTVKMWRRRTGMLVMGYEAFGIMTNERKLDKMVSPKKRAAVLEALVDPGPDLVICDEGHLLKNKQTQRTLALNKVNTKRRIVLTGTPLQNNLIEYYHMVHFVKPNLLGTEKEFKTNFVNPISNGQYEDSTQQDIKLMKKRTHILHRVLENTVQRVEDHELERYLPKRVDYAVFIQLSPLQVQMYNAYMQHAEGLRDGVVNNKCFLTDVQIVKYICSHPHVLNVAERLSKRKIKEKDVIDDEGVVAKAEKSSIDKGFWKSLQPGDVNAVVELGHKLAVVRSIIEESEAVGDKVLIFSQSIAEMDTIEHFLYKCGTSRCPTWKSKLDYYRMDGTIPPEERTRMCNRFNNVGNTRMRVFIMSTKVGGLGLNLTAANRVIIMTVHWNPSYDTQSVFRAYRFGQSKTVYIYRLISIDTMEEKIYQRQVTKLAIAHRVVDRHQITRHYSSMDLEELYSLRPMAGKQRPLPMVPEDKILAKLIQRLPYVFRWHEHRALLANRPEEDLNEDEKKDAWEEFTKREKDPPQQMPPTANPNMMPQYPQPQFVTAGNLVMPSTSSATYNNAVFNPTLQRVDSASNFNVQFRPAVYANNFYVAGQQKTTAGQKVAVVGQNPQDVTNVVAMATNGENVEISTCQGSTVARNVVMVPGSGAQQNDGQRTTEKDPLEIPVNMIRMPNPSMLFKALANVQEKLAEAKKALNQQQQPTAVVNPVAATNQRNFPSVVLRKPPTKVHRTQNGLVSEPIDLTKKKPIDLTKKKAIDLTRRKPIIARNVKVPSPLPDASIHSDGATKRSLVASARRNLVFSDKENERGRLAISKSEMVKQMAAKFKEKLKSSGVTMEEHVNLVEDETDAVSDTTMTGSAVSLNTEIIRSLTMNGVSINKVIEKANSSVITLE